MKKLFEISWDYGASGADIAKLEAKQLEEILRMSLIVSPKVKEIKPTNFCYAPMSVEKKHCECIHGGGVEVDNKGLCIMCKKPLSIPKPPIEEPEAPIEELDLRSKEFEVYMVGEKVNEIIGWIENHSKEDK